MAYLRGDTSTLEASEPSLLGAPGLKPHIAPGVLYPSYVASGTSNKLLDGSTAHSGAFGTAQSDGRKYYYTNIAGSRKIKDPQIGAHFGSQRHKFRSLQLLEQETATHGSSIYSIDGREWCRVVAKTTGAAGADGFTILNDSGGHYIQFAATADTNEDYIEFTGYFNALNIIEHCSTTRKAMHFSLNGTSNIANFTDNSTSIGTPLLGRYVDPGAVLNVPLTSISLGINTIRMEMHGGNQHNRHYGIELIVQDTTSTATKSQIQIPSQNVVSYGKKFTVSGTPHYDPFNGFTNSTSLHSAYVDTATSLGLSTAPGSSASWAISGSNNIRPYNGGRVVKWVDSSGVIKTSVNMMPPNAQNILGTVIGTTEVTTPSATNTTPTPIFSNDAIDNSLAEVAKTFHVREFGNGSANAGSAAGSWRDTSMIGSAADQNLAYVMDDGLTCFSGQGMDGGQAMGTGTAHGQQGAGLMPQNQDGNPDWNCLTFIGTGVSKDTWTWGPGKHDIVQNLPYGTHILKMRRANINPTITIDGVSMGAVGIGTYGNFFEVSFHQPKMPPIPENAVVIADYMLMADTVVRSSYDEFGNYGKGDRVVNCSRDAFYDQGSGSPSLSQHILTPNASLQGFKMSLSNDNTTKTIMLPFFGTGITMIGGDTGAGTDALTFNLSKDGGANFYPISDANISSHFSGASRFDDFTGTFSTSGVLDTSAGSDVFNHIAGIKGLTPGNYILKLVSSSAAHYVQLNALSPHIPIHTSSHYQSFETPHLNELVGGDRNMEQNNLVVTPAGKTWDEVTRNTSYIGNLVLTLQETTEVSESAFCSYTDCRGVHQGEDMTQKDFAIAYERAICLKDGAYKIVVMSIGIGGGWQGEACQIYVNKVEILKGYYSDSGYSFQHTSRILNLKRGDYVQIKGAMHANSNYHRYYIFRQPDFQNIKGDEPKRTDLAATQNTPNRWAAGQLN